MPIAADERLTRGHVVLRPRTPVDVLRPEVAQRLLQRVHLFEVADDQRKRRLEVTLERRQIRGERAAAGSARRRTVRRRSGPASCRGSSETSRSCPLICAMASGVIISRSDVLATPAADGGPGTSGEMLPEVYDELRKLARARLARERQPHQTLQPTALVHEAYLRVSGDGQDRLWDRRGHFFAAAALAMRRILVERARHYQRIKHGARRNASNSTARSCAPIRR